MQAETDEVYQSVDKARVEQIGKQIVAMIDARTDRKDQPTRALMESIEALATAVGIVVRRVNPKTTDEQGLLDYFQTAYEIRRALHNMHGGRPN